MPCLKTLSSPLRHYTPHSTADAYAKHEQQRDFSALLNPSRPKHVLSLRHLHDTGQPRLRSALAQAFAPDITRLDSLGRGYPGTLDLRLTNGPLAGLEIRASARDNLFCLTVKVVDRDTFEHIAGTHAVLESELIAVFNRPVALTLQHPNGESW